MAKIAPQPWESGESRFRQICGQLRVVSRLGNDKVGAEAVHRQKQKGEGGVMKVDSILHLLLAGLCVLAVSESAFAGASGGPPPAVAEQVLYKFCSLGGCTDGSNPSTGLIMDGSGNLYGTTEFGGSHSAGTVFKLAPTMTGWVETVLYSFCALGGNACTDGGLPLSALIMDGAGNLYGTTDAGGTNGGGVAFRIAPNGTETVLYSFCALGGSACTDGTDPLAGLIMDPAGNLYGAAELGGSHSKGAVYKIAPSGSGWTETVLYSFCSQSSCVDGANPAASLLMDVAGNLYGTTVNGGNDFCGPNNTSPCGTVFQLTGLGSTLSVSIIGNPGGRVTSSPSGINCGSTCSASFAIGTPVTLTATPSGWNFGGWSGACTGSGSCAVTMNSNQAVTATFWTNGSVVPYPSPAGAPQVSGVPSPAPATP